MDITSVETVDRGPQVVARRALVHAPAHDLWAALADPRRHHEVDGSGSVRAEIIGPRELRTGDRFQVAMRMAGFPYRITSTASEVVPDRVVEWRHPGGHRWRWEFDPQPGGATLVTESFDYSGARFPGVYPRIKADERNARWITATLRNLQRMHPPAD